jgi:hypothetical protein
VPAFATGLPAEPATPAAAARAPPAPSEELEPQPADTEAAHSALTPNPKNRRAASLDIDLLHGGSAPTRSLFLMVLIEFRSNPA